MSVNLEPVLYQYGINPERIETFGKVSKVFAGRRVYALKETNMSVEERAWFVHVLERFHHVGFDRYAAPYATRGGDPIVVHEGKTYYLMRWLQDEDPGILSKEERLIETGAVLHVLTEKEQKYSEEVVEASFQRLDERWAAYVAEIERFAKKSEEQIYFSPFELAFLSNFRVVMAGAEASRYRLKRWLEKAKNLERFRIVLCHGRFTVSHFINGDLLNFEHAVLDSPVRDLAMLFRYAMMKFSTDDGEPFDWLKTYEERFALRKEERWLLAAYLTFPEPICMSVRDYCNRTKNEEELGQVEKLEYRVRGLINGQKLADRILAEP